jgi:type I restriction-modification system DNA methylase subunit
MYKSDESEWMEENPAQWDCEFTEKELIAFAEVYHKWKVKQLKIVEDLTKDIE